jgi:asparagine synthase (glutamine-hydrolysing)
MSAIAGYVGNPDPSVLTRMLDAVAWRGERNHIIHVPGAGIGQRVSPGKQLASPASVNHQGHLLAAVSGAFMPSAPAPAAELPAVLTDADRLAALDGSFAAACWDGLHRRLSLLRDPFGIQSLYHTTHEGVLYFASEVKQLLAIPGLPINADLAAIHKYLTFSFVPGEDMPIRGIKRLPPGVIATWENGALHVTPYFALHEQIDPVLSDDKLAVPMIRRLCRRAVAKRLDGQREVGLYLSSGLDSSGVAAWLKQAGVNVRAFTLDFGSYSIEKDQARRVADKLGIELTSVTVTGDDLPPLLMDLVWKLDLPFGDPVTGPQYLLARAAHTAGLTVAFNGEGGDQLFGGWTSKPMLSAQLYAGLHGQPPIEQLYLHCYHRFHELEQRFYTPEFLANIGPPGARRALLAPHLHSERMQTFLSRVRLADINLKGSQNILPRMTQTNLAWGIDVRAPLFDRALAQTSFMLPPKMKLHGSNEKYIFKRALRKFLPAELLRRPKLGMSVPITQWALGPLAMWLGQMLGPTALAQRGLFQPEAVAQLLQGHDLPGQIRRRHLGERLWTLAMLEAWLRVFIDGKGKAPEGSS